MPHKNLKIEIASRKPLPVPAQKEVSSLLDKPMASLSLDEKKEEPVGATVTGNVRERAQTFVQPQAKEQQNESDSSSSESEAEVEAAGEQKQAEPQMVHGSMKVPKKNPKREDKAYRKQRKVIRKMIRRQMMDHSREIIKGLVEEDFQAKN